MQKASNYSLNGNNSIKWPSWTLDLLTIELKVTWFASDRREDQHVRRNHGDERQEKHQQDGEAAVELFLPSFGVRTERHALVELFGKRTTFHAENVRLQFN